MQYVSAKYIKGFDGSIFVEATGDDGNRYFLPETSDVPPWPEYRAGGGTIEPADPVSEPVPEQISDRQFFQQLAVEGLITEDEALAAVQTGTLPAAILAFIDQLPAEQRFPAKMLLTGATTFNRSNSLVGSFAGLYGMTSDDVDDLWRAASAL